MTISFKKITSTFALVFFGAMWLAPVTLAQVNCDVDGDGFIAFPASGTDVILGQEFDRNGNYSSMEWDAFFSQFKADPVGATLCNDLNFKQGAEPSRCDEVIIPANSGVYDSSKVNSVSGSKVNPGAFDSPGDGIDQDCDGADGELVLNVGTTAADVEGLANRALTWLAGLVVFVSIVFMVWGGVQYASSGGDEQKNHKAKRTIIGAVIGLIVGLLAPTIVGSIVSLF